MTDETEHPAPSIEQRLALLEQLATTAERRFEMIAARLDWMTHALEQPTPTPSDVGAAAWAPDFTSQRWHKRAGTVYGTYTYRGTHAAPAQILDRMDPQLRRSCPAKE